MVRVFLGLKVVSHPTLAFTLGYKPKNCIKITTEQAKLTKCKFLNFSVNAGTQQLPARPGPERTGSVQSWPPVAEGLSVPCDILSQRV